MILAGLFHCHLLLETLGASWGKEKKGRKRRKRRRRRILEQKQNNKKNFGSSNRSNFFQDRMRKSDLVHWPISNYFGTLGMPSIEAPLSTFSCKIETNVRPWHLKSKYLHWLFICYFIHAFLCMVFIWDIFISIQYMI